MDITQSSVYIQLTGIVIKNMNRVSVFPFVDIFLTGKNRAESVNGDSS